LLGPFGFVHIWLLFGRIHTLPKPLQFSADRWWPGGLVQGLSNSNWMLSNKPIKGTTRIFLQPFYLFLLYSALDNSEGQE
jgi:hypothetical protein